MVNFSIMFPTTHAEKTTEDIVMKEIIELHYGMRFWSKIIYKIVETC